MNFNCWTPTLPNRGTAMDNINHPPHYNQHPSGVEAIDICEHLSFNVGNAIKYLFRCGHKTPDGLEDLKKAQWYLQRELGVHVRLGTAVEYIDDGRNQMQMFMQAVERVLYVGEDGPLERVLTRLRERMRDDRGFVPVQFLGDAILIVQDAIRTVS